MASRDESKHTKPAANDDEPDEWYVTYLVILYHTLAHTNEFGLFRDKRINDTGCAGSFGTLSCEKGVWLGRNWLMMEQSQF